MVDTCFENDYKCIIKPTNKYGGNIVGVIKDAIDYGSKAVQKMGGAICWLSRKTAGTPSIERNLQDLRTHTSAMTSVLHLCVADLMAKWPLAQRKEVLEAIAKFSVIDEGLGKVERNPLTIDEVQRLRKYTNQARAGQLFTVSDAKDFRLLAERASQEYAGQEWVAELLKVALLIFAIYVVAQILRPRVQ